jgi:hypothetical protein
MNSPAWSIETGFTPPARPIRVRSDRIECFHWPDGDPVEEIRFAEQPDGTLQGSCPTCGTVYEFRPPRARGGDQ